jgi:hypothetical protein
MDVLVACEFSGVVRDAFIHAGHDAVSCDKRPTEQEGPHIQGDALTILNDGWDMLIAHPPCTYLANSGVWALYQEDERWKDLIDGAVFFRKLWEADIPKICVENPVMHKYAKKIIGCGKQDQTIQPYQFGHPESKRTCFWLKNLPELEPTDYVSPPGWEFVKYAGDCEECDLCAEPYCEEHQEHYADCDHYGPTEERLNYAEVDDYVVASEDKEEIQWENQTTSGQNKLGPSEDRSKIRGRTYEGIAKAMAQQWG